MDLNLEISSNEGNSSEPLFHSIMNVINSMKEATADKIYHRIQREGITQYSKPQVDRALASALKYGIFQVRNNRYRVRDDVLDDEDTIYWQAQLKREETPYWQGENNHEDYINPEKDRLTFRRLRVYDNKGCITCRNKRDNNTEGRRQKCKNVRSNNQKYIHSSSSNSKVKRFRRDQLTKKHSTTNRPNREKRIWKSKASSPKGKLPEQKKLRRALRDITLKDVKTIKRVTRLKRNSIEYGYRKRRASIQGSDSNASEIEHGAPNGQCRNGFEVKSKCNTRGCHLKIVTKSNITVNSNVCENESEYKDGGDALTVSEPHQITYRVLHSSYLDYMKEPFRKIISERGSNTKSLKMMKYLSGTADKSDSTGNHSPFNNAALYNEISCNLKSSSKQNENNLLDEWFGKPDWLGNRLQNAHNGTVKQFEKALKIEPLDSLPFRNTEEASYIT